MTHTRDHHLNTAATASDRGVGGGFGDFARELAGAAGAPERLTIGVDLATELVEGCEHASVTEATPTGFKTTAASDQKARDADQWQYELGEGPCVQTVLTQHTVLSLDLATEQRWPRWSARIVDRLGVASSLSLLLYTDQQSYGAMNFYGRRPSAFDGDALAVAHSIAAHLAVAVAASHQAEHLSLAIASRTTIGQAEGILMERFAINADQAFNYLRRVSQATHRKLVVVAEDLVTTRTLPELDQSE